MTKNLNILNDVEQHNQLQTLYYVVCQKLHLIKDRNLESLVTIFIESLQLACSNNLEKKKSIAVIYPSGN